MTPDSPNWVVLGEPASPAEAAALDAFRKLLVDDGITRAWVNLTFIDRSGRLGEIDVLLLTRRGFYVVELKGWHGTIDGNQQAWRQVVGGATKYVGNPLILADKKAKRLASLLRDVHPNAPLPYLGALIVLHGHDAKVDLNELGRTGVLALDGFGVKGKLPLVSAFLAAAPDNPNHLIDRPRATAARKACDKAGFQKTPRQRVVGQYVLDESDPVAAGPDWQDFVVTHPGLGDKRRLRLYDMPPKASADDRQRIEQAARRELRLTETLRHEGVEAPLDLLVTDSGPALLFRYVPDAQPLDQFLQADSATLAFGERLGLIRQIGDILRYAHKRRLTHRALAPQRVWVTRAVKGAPRLTIRDWYVGQRQAGTRTQMTALSAGVSDVRGAVGADDWVYLAPEALHGAADLPSIPLDVYGLGALAYLVLTGEPPAATLPELQEKFTKTGYLDPSAASDAIPDQVADVVRNATATAEPLRTVSIDDVLAELDQAEHDIRPPTQAPTPAQDPLDAQAGDAIAERFLVEARRGEGSTGTALLVTDVDAEDDRPVILKVARNEAADRRLAIEAEVLATLDHPRIVKLIDGPIEVDGRTALVLTDAGTETLAGRIEKEGRSTIEQLERYGRDLLEAVAHLDTRGVFHRDIKPANLAIAPDPGSRKPRLTLFDLSLAREPLDNVKSGTGGYLDPYLGASGRHQYDRAAELWAVAATLFEMATGTVPWWSDGGAGPMTPDEAPVVMATSFEDAVAPQLTTFFVKALAPTAGDRFAVVADLAEAWQSVFADLDAAAQTSVGDDGAAAVATLTTPLASAGLSARALSGLARLEAVTVEDLLGVPPMQINQIRGLGEQYRKEIQRRIREWRQRLGATTVPMPVAPGRGIEGILRVLMDTPRSARADEPVLRALLGLTPADESPDDLWPTPRQVARLADASTDAANAAVNRAAERWRKLDLVTDLATHLVELLDGDGRVMTAGEAAAAFAARQGSQLEGRDRVRHTVGVLRALVEVEQRTEEPRFAVRRRDEAAPLLALTESVDLTETGSAHLAADVLADLAIDLGRRADELSADGVVPTPLARAELRAALADGADLSDERLVRLAAATSESTAVSSFGELYRRDLAIADAVEHALRGRPGRVITETWVRRRVFARFPDLEATVPSHPRLDDLVIAALPGMSWNGTQYVARDSSTTPPSVSYVATVIGLPGAEVDRTLQTSLRQHAPLCLGVAPHRYQQAAQKLADRYRIDVVDVGLLVVRATRALAAGQEVDWQVVLDADAAARDSYDWQMLSDLVAEALDPEWREAMAADRPLLVTNAGALVRYGIADRLSDLLDVGASRPAARWLLVARSGSTAVPVLEGQSVPLGPSGVLDLPPNLAFLDVPATHGAAT